MPKPRPPASTMAVILAYVMLVALVILTVVFVMWVVITFGRWWKG